MANHIHIRDAALQYQDDTGASNTLDCQDIMESVDDRITEKLRTEEADTPEQALYQLYTEDKITSYHLDAAIYNLL
jgi:hypothetical protein